MGFGQGLSGLNAAAQTLDVIGNNIANSGTVGFKAGTATFADVYANSRVGLGTQVASINQRFTIGTIAGTGNQFDMAIDGAKGMFRVVDPSGNVLYTRNGQFFADKDNYIVNAQGQRLTGYVGGGNNIGPVMVPVGNIAPQATSTLTTKANFDANAPVISANATERIGVVVLDDGVNVDTFHYRIDSLSGDIVWTDSVGGAGSVPAAGTYQSGTPPQSVEFDATGQLTNGTTIPASGENIAFAIVPPIAFDPIDPDSYTHFLPMNVYDSLGNAHQLTQYFVKRDAVGNDSAWDVYYRLDNQPLPVPHDDTNPARLMFDAGGRLISGGGQTINVPNPGGAASPAQPMTIAINYGNSTQYGGPFSPNFTQNGYPTGEYASMSIAADGAIVANYTNGEVQAVGTLVLADFNNLQGLQPVGGNAWIETATSGQPILGRPGSNSLATIKGQAVEESNVDMSQELVNMIIAQRTYQANAQTIKTQDQIMQTLISMR